MIDMRNQTKVMVYTLQGVRLTEQPRVKGLYIHREKVVVACINSHC
jgi:hypothetical protein